MNLNKQVGQATAETLISMLALAPLLILTPYIGKYLDVKSKAVEGNRYAAFQRTLFSDPGASWGANENSRSDQQIATDVAQRVLGDPRDGILTNGNTAARDNPLWRNHLGGTLIAAGSELADGAVVSETDAPVSRSRLVDLLSSGTSVFGLFDIGLDLNKKGYVSQSVSVPVIPLPDFEPRGAGLSIVASEEAGFTFTRSGSVLTDPWMASSEDNFADRIDGLTADEALQLIVLPGTFTFGFLPPFLEGIKGQDADLTSESNVVLFSDIDPL